MGAWNVTIVMPVLNDWDSARTLLQRIDGLDLPGVEALAVLIVNDGSTLPQRPDLCAGLGAGRIGDVAVLDLVCNVGHQRAIALGIAAVARRDAGAHVLVMDSDGEDDPADIPRLLDVLGRRPEAIVVAGRARRSEGVRFRLGYAAYQALFRLLVGKRIDFGNFAAFGPALVARLSRTAETWNHLAATLLRSRVELVTVPTQRASRYAGQPTTNIPSLVAHGLSAFAVFSDYVFARLLLLASGLGAFAMVGSVIVLVIRLGTNLAIPGWASTLIAMFVVLFVQAILVCLVAALQMLATRSQPGAQPAMLLDLFVRQTVEVPLGRRE